jgi:hypothetical protein
MNPKTNKTSAKDRVSMAITSLQHGGRAGATELKEIADMSVVDLLSGGLTLEQAQTVVNMAAIEIARISEEARMARVGPGIDVKFKKGKK